MTREKWQELVEKIRTSFDVIEHEKEKLDPEEGGGVLEYIIFAGPLGEMRMELSDTPRVVGSTVLQSKRIGSTAHETLKYDESERVLTLHIYRWNEIRDDWEELKSDSLEKL